MGFVCSSEVRSHLIAIGLLVAEIFMFESVNKRTHRRRLDSNPISSTLLPLTFYVKTFFFGGGVGWGGGLKITMGDGLDSG